MLGLTLAELLLLLLFLFLLITTSLIFNRDNELKEVTARFSASETERLAFRNALGPDLGLDRYGNRPLTRSELDAPLASIRELNQQKEALADELTAARTELGEARKSVPDSAQEVSKLREQTSVLSNKLARAESDLVTYNRLKSRAAIIDPAEPPPQLIETALNEFADKQLAPAPKSNPLAVCKAELNNANARTSQAEARCRPGRNGDYPSCVYRDDGRAAYVYQVSLTENGAIVQSGDTGSYEQIPWVAALPKLPLNRSIPANEFIALSIPFRIAGDRQTPACRFYIRVSDDMGRASREDFKRLYLSVQSNFYHHLER